MHAQETFPSATSPHCKSLSKCRGLVFLVGEVPDPELMAELREEHLSHGDLVQVSVRDHYTALSYKTLSGFVWVNR